MATLKEQLPSILKYIQDNLNYLDQNRIKLDIYNGNLLPYIQASLKKILSEDYYKKIEERIIPINVLQRIINKISKSYITKPLRSVDEAYKEDIEYYEKQFQLNVRGQKSDEYSNLFKGYAWEPYLHNGVPKLRVLPFDRFLPYSSDSVDHTNVTVFIKFMGKRNLVKGGKNKTLDVYHLFSDAEFLSVDSEGEAVLEDMIDNEGVNPYGVIPFYFGNRGNDTILPVQDTDIISMVKMVPIHLTDLSGAILFQCFSIMWGIDVNSENLTMSPNAFWSFKSDPTSDKTPNVGTIKPEADIEKVISFIMTTFTLWLETKGIRVGSLGSTDGANLASGISKVIDEMDVTELIQKSQTEFATDEPAFWKMFSKVNNYWVSNALIQTKEKPGILPEDIEVTLTFDEIEPFVDRATEVNTFKTERDAGFISTKAVIVKLNPDMKEDQVDKLIKEIEDERSIVVGSPAEEPEVTT